MKVLQINTVYQNGGSTGRIAWEIQRLSQEKGIDAYVAYGYSTGNGRCDHEKELQGTLRRKLNILRCRMWPRHGFYNEEETKRLIRWMNEIKPDIIHLHNIHNSYINVGVLFDYIKVHNIPVVWTLHDCWSFTGWCAYFDYAGCDKWQTHCHNCPNIHDYPTTWFFDLSESNFDKKRECFSGVKSLTLVTPSQWLADLTRKSYLKEYPVKVINNGIDTSVFKPCNDDSDIRNKYGIGDSKMILAMAMQMGKRKGIDYLLAMREQLNADECLVLVGGKPSEMEKLKTDRCVCIPRTSNVEELAAIYSAADVFINPTLEDNFPTTNIEALSCGTPVITFRTGGSVESVDDSVGMIVEKGDGEALLHTVREVLAKGKSSYTNACREKALRLYDKRERFMEYIELYKKISIRNL